MVGDALLRSAVGFRHGVVPSVQEVATTMCDIPGVFHASAPRSGARPWDNPAGGVGWTWEGAERAAIGEALERYAAVSSPLPGREEADLPPDGVIGPQGFSLFSAEQQRRPGFPHAALYAEHGAGRGIFTNVFGLADNRPCWVPRFLVGLGDEAAPGLGTSSGLAAAPSHHLAALRATQEIIERDAFVTIWNHGLGGRRVALPERYAELAAARGGEVDVFDASPAYSPHCVAMVSGWVPARGRRRIAFGVACRATWQQAVDKAFLEWCQGVLFAGVYCMWHPDLEYRSAEDVATFEAHAAYTLHPERWDRVPLLAAGVDAGPPAPPSPPETVAGQLAALVAALTRQGVRLYYRELPSPDLSQIGIHVIRVLSPDLTPIHCDHAWPHGGGRASELSWRYPWAAPSTTGFPSPYPHPLG